jgi:hypothetical protein
MDAGVNDRFERSARLGIGKDDLSQLAPVQRSIGQQHAGPEALDHGTEAVRARRHDFTRKTVGIDDRHPEAFECRSDC